MFPDPSSYPHINYLYRDLFLPKYLERKIEVDRNIFCQPEILDILNQESKSFLQLSQHLQHIVGKKIKNLLVVGTGSGALADVLADQLHPNSMVEIDLLQDVIDRRRKVLQSVPHRTAAVANVEKTEFATASFDLLVAYGVLRYVKNPKNALSEMLRLVTEQGVILLGEGRMKSVVDEYQRLLNPDVTFSSVTLQNVPLPNLTFAYFLVDRYESTTDPELQSIVENEVAKNGSTIYSSLFKMAGVTVGDIHVLNISKVKRDT